MKERKVITIKSQLKEDKLVLPQGAFHSDWFLCRNCGYEVQVKTMSNVITCGECGGTMDRK